MEESEKQDFNAFLSGLKMLAAEIRSETEPVRKIMAYSAARTLIDHLQESSDQYPEPGNIRQKLVSLETGLRGLAGLYPSYTRSEDDHVSYINNTIKTLKMIVL